jgi:hypothetical protein
MAMNDEKRAGAAESADPSATPRPPATPAPATSAAKAAAADLDFALEEIQRPELMKEGFVGQER